MGKYNFNKRQQASLDDSGTERRGSSIFNFTDIDVTFFQPAERNKIDILPFKISSKLNPAVASGKYKIDEYDYALVIYVHKFIGPLKGDYICPRQNYGKPCPICEEGRKLYLSGDQKGGLALNAKKRVFYNIIDRMGENDHVQVLDQSFEWFEKELVRSAAAVEDEDGMKTGEVVDYASPDVGYRVLFRMEESDLKSSNGKPVLKPARFTFKPRESIEDRLSDAISLDKYLVVKSYQELQAALEGGDEIEVSESGYIKDTATIISEPTNARSTAAPSLDCPFGHEFGVDNDEYPECDGCAVWKQCAKAPRK